jgi:outer membrane lipoprotein
MRSHLIVVACLFLSACGGLPSAVRNVPVKDVPVREASENPNLVAGTSVRWGGLIMNVDNEKNHTLVQVLSYPLNFYGLPEVTKPSQGRFVMKTSEFLDPAVYEKDRQITVAGVLQGDIEVEVGNKTILVPLLAAKAHHLWPVYQNVPSGYGYGPGGYGYGGYGPAPYYWGGSYWPYGW